MSTINSNKKKRINSKNTKTRGNEIKENLNVLDDTSNNLTQIDVARSPSKVRFSTVDSNNSQKIGQSYTTKEQDKKENDSKNFLDGKNKQRKSSSSVMNNVSNAIKTKKEMDKEKKKEKDKKTNENKNDSINIDENELKGDKDRNQNSASTLNSIKQPTKSSLKSSQKIIIQKNQESDPSSYETPVTPPRLLVPAVSGAGPPTYSPDKLSKLGEQLSALDIHHIK